jgi:hypothetical protein
MHNTGDLLLLTGAAEHAAVWLNRAAAVYAAVIQDTEAPHPGLLEYYFISAARLTMALLQTEHADSIHDVVESTIYLAQAHPETTSGFQAQAAFEMMRAALRTLGSERDDFVKELTQLQLSTNIDDWTLPNTAFAEWSMRLAESADTAIRLVQLERWGDALDAFLSAANAARDTGALEHDVIETGIRVGLALAISKLDRQLARPPARWHEAWGRFAEWESGLEDLLPHQQARLHIISAAAEGVGPFEEIRDARDVVEMHRGRPLPDDEVEMWLQLVDDLEQLRVMRQPWEAFTDNLVAGANVHLVHTAGGGEDAAVWLFQSSIGLPGVAFVNVSARVNHGDGWQDGQIDNMREAGFPQHDPDRSALAIPDGWEATIRGDQLILADARDVIWLTADIRDLDAPPTWRSQARRARLLHVIYGDVGDAEAAELIRFPNQAAVRLRHRRNWWPFHRK